jgi:hypothetical protein
LFELSVPFPVLIVNYRSNRVSYWLFENLSWGHHPHCQVIVHWLLANEVCIETWVVKGSDFGFLGTDPKIFEQFLLFFVLKSFKFSHLISVLSLSTG